MPENPLATASKPPGIGPRDDPMTKHAEAWARMKDAPTAALEQHATFLDYSLPIVGALANNPKVRARDVIRAVTDAVGKGIIEPSRGVQIVSQLPADDAKLRPWLLEKYKTGLSEAIHAKAVLMGRMEDNPDNPMASNGPGNPGMPQGMPGNPLSGGMR